MEGRRRSVPGERDRYRRQSPLGRFITTWGWRAYAIPVLLVLTTLVVADAVRSPDIDETSSSGRPPLVSDAPPAAPAVLPPSGGLPEGGPFVEKGEGTYRVVRGTTSRVGGPGAEQFDYTIEVENGVDLGDSGGDEAVGRMVDATLTNPKSWTADGKVAFRRVDRGSPTFRVTVASPDTVHARCGYDIKLESSCFHPGDGRVYLNLARWVRGALTFQGDMGSYRQYLINHEVGHAVGHPEHVACPAEGALAPIMMQQTFGVRNSDIFQLDPEGVVPDNGLTCRYNAWPFPAGSPAPR